MVMFNNNSLWLFPVKKQTQTIKQLLAVLSLITLLCLLPTTSWANVKAFLNQNNVYIDDPITLTIEINANSQNVTDQPDLSPLKKDFALINTSSRSQISIVNGVTSAKKSWVVQLQPLRKGKLTIPAITLGNEKTQALTVTVTDVSADIAKETQQHVFVEAAVTLKDNKAPYVQQQISYTAKLFYDDHLLEYEMYSPNVENAVIEPLQQKDRYQVTRNGKRYNVIERNYVISAEKSGELTIPPTIVKGRMQDRQANQRQRNDPFFNDRFSSYLFGERGKEIALRSKALTVDVQPLPTAFKGNNWLPAEQVQLEDSWQQHLPTFRVGQPVQRVVTIQVKGSASSQIPQLEFVSTKAVRVYSEKEDNQNYTDGNTVIGARTQTMSYIPNQAGQVTLPEITLDWWNVVTKQQQTARLPAMTITIEAGSGGDGLQTQSVMTNSMSPASSQDQSSSVDLDNNNNADSSGHPDGTSSLFVILSFIIGLIIVLLGVFMVMKNKTALLNAYQAQTWFTRRKPSTPSHQKQLYKQLQQACEQNDAPQVARYVLAIVQQQWSDDDPVPQSIGALAEQLATGAELVRQLDQSLYAEDNADWTGDALWELVSKQGLQQKSMPIMPAEDGVEALYPVR